MGEGDGMNGNRTQKAASMEAQPGASQPQKLHFLDLHAQNISINTGSVGYHRL
jgi:hypothetical protein